MAERLKTVLPELISAEQTGFLQNRHISENIRRTLEVIKYAEKEHIPGIIVSIDFEKCFDKLAHSAIYGAFEYFNFPKSYIDWIKLFFTKFEVCTQNFGTLSPPPSKKEKDVIKDATFHLFAFFYVEK